MKTPIKICGLTRLEDVQTAIRLDVQALGFVFYPPSPRYIAPKQAQALIAAIPAGMTPIGLFVNATPEQIQEAVQQSGVQLLQFHGDETPEQCQAIADVVKMPFLRAVRIRPDMTGADLLQYESSYRAAGKWFSALLLDTFVDSYGGSGKVFDWSVIPKELAHRVVLSGGLTVHNVSGAVSEIRPGAVDVSSGVELAKGIKDPARMQAFVQAVRLADTYHTPQSYEFHFQSS